MVGVPGKSKGCITCRRRKIRCDEQKPCCSRCVSSGRTCEGYDKFPVFLNSTMAGRSKRKHLEEARPKGPSGTGKFFISDSQPSSIHMSTAPSPTIDTSKPVDNVQILRSPAGGDESMTSAALIGRFVNEHSPPAASVHGDWLFLAAGSHTTGSALELALKATAWSRAGFGLGERTFTEHSRRYYALALSSTQAALLKPNASSEETLAACLLLALYEMYESKPGDRNGFKDHIVGCAKFVQVRGYDNFAGPLGTDLAWQIRWLLLIFEFNSRKKMDSSQIGPASLSINPTTLAKLEIVLLELNYSAVELIASHDDLVQRANLTDPISCGQMSIRFDTLTGKLSIWNSALSQTLGYAPYTIIESTTSLISEPRPGDVWAADANVMFPDAHLAILMQRYWVTVIMILQTQYAMLTGLEITEFSLRASPTDRRPHLPVQELVITPDTERIKAKLIHLATCISRSAAYMNLPRHGIATSSYYIFPLRVAAFILQSFSSHEALRTLLAFKALSWGRGYGWAKTIGKARAEYDGQGRVIDME